MISRIGRVAVASLLLFWLLPAGVSHAAVTSGVSQGVLTITGGATADLVSVTCFGGNVKVNNANPGTGSFPCAKVVRISVDTQNGEDVIDLTNATIAAFPAMGEATVYAGGDDDIVTAPPVGAFISGGTGEDTLNGRAGPDRLNGDAGQDAINGAGGFDVVGTATSLPGPAVLTPSSLVAGGETDTLSSIEGASLSVVGSTYDGSAFPGPQRISAKNGVSVLTGSGNDTLVVATGGGPNGSLDGGPGVDTIEGQLDRSVTLAPDRIEIEATTYTLSKIERGFLFWQAIALQGGTVNARKWKGQLRYENWGSKKVTFLGGRGRDSATGGSGQDILKGFRGKDVLLGGPGDDALVGGPGKDTCRGGSGKNKISGCEG
jgi:Ca2+-binding RTX toxin-like protein